MTKQELLNKVIDIIKNGDITRYMPIESTVAKHINKENEWFISQTDLLNQLEKLKED